MWVGICVEDTSLEKLFFRFSFELISRQKIIPVVIKKITKEIFYTTKTNDKNGKYFI